MSRSPTLSSSSNTAPLTYPIKIALSTPSGAKLILARKLLSTPPPLLSVLKNCDLSEAETDLFSQFTANCYYSAILNNTGLPANITYAAAPNTPYNIPSSPNGPGMYQVFPEGDSADPGLRGVMYGTFQPLSDEFVENDILESVARLRKAQRGENGSSGVSEQDPETGFVVFTNHSPFNLMVSNGAIADGFYKKLYALQGQRNTY